MKLDKVPESWRNSLIQIIIQDEAAADNRTDWRDPREGLPPMRHSSRATLVKLMELKSGIFSQNSL